MSRGELQRHKQPTDIQVSGSSNVAPYVVLGVVALVTLAVVALAIAVTVACVAIVVVVLAPSINGNRRGRK